MIERGRDLDLKFIQKLRQMEWKILGGEKKIDKREYRGGNKIIEWWLDLKFEPKNEDKWNERYIIKGRETWKYRRNIQIIINTKRMIERGSGLDLKFRNWDKWNEIFATFLSTNIARVVKVRELKLFAEQTAATNSRKRRMEVLKLLSVQEQLKKEMISSDLSIIFLSQCLEHFTLLNNTLHVSIKH